MKLSAKEKLKKIYKEKGIYEVTKITGLASYDVIRLLDIKLNTVLSNEVLTDLVYDKILPNPYKNISFTVGNDGVWYLDSIFELNDGIIVKVGSMATPFWDGTDILPIDTNYFEFFEGKDNKTPIKSEEAELYDSFDVSGNFENIEKLIEWYRDFYLPKVEKVIKDHLDKFLTYDD